MRDPAHVDPQAQKPTAAALQDKLNQGIAFYQQGRLVEAERIYREVLRQQPTHSGALHLLGLIALHTRHTERAVELIQKAIVLKPDFTEAHFDRGNALYNLKRYEEAVTSYDKVIALKQDFAEAYSNRGLALRDLKRPDEALASFDRAIALKPNFAEAYYNRGVTLHDLKRLEDAVATYDRAIALKPNFAEAYYNRGNALRGLNRHEEALSSYDNAIALNANHAMAYNNRGNALFDLRRPEDALMSYDEVIALQPDRAEAHRHRGIVLQYLNRSDEAFAAYDKAVALGSNAPDVEGVRLIAKMRICNWSNFEPECAHLISSVRGGKVRTSPFPFLVIPSSAADQLQCAKMWVEKKFPLSDTPVWRGDRYSHSRICVGYFSADFHAHATAQLTAELFESHDRSRFEVIAISFGPDDNDGMRKRLSSAFDRFIDARNLSDRDVAMLSRRFEIDIAIDLKGFTEHNRTGIFAFRAAPIQVNYLGYPGTMGANYIDYLIADTTLIPVSNQSYFSEKIIYLPNSYQVNDRKRRIADKIFNRAEFGLPEDAFVFCCFNNNYKIAPDVFDSWMRILKRVDGSVLWLLEANTSAASNMREEAGARGVDPKRLVFAKRMSLPDHLARHRVADLFLDTLPCNAHTTASDALWAGLPVLTRIGETFAGRVAASLLTAIGLPELITATPQAYENLAIDLATRPEKLVIIKRKLVENRLTTPLFDTKLFTKHIEAAYTAMYKRHQLGLPPDHIYVPQ